MASTTDVEIIVDIGEDFAAQLIWYDSNGDLFPILTPCKMQMKDSVGNIALTLSTDNTNYGTDALISIASSQDGFMELYIAKAVTTTLTPGTYAFDLFATTEAYASTYTTTGTASSGGSTITLGNDDTTLLKTGWLVEGDKIQSNTRISTINTTTDVLTLSKSITGTISAGSQITITRLQEVKVISGYVTVRNRITTM